MTVKSAAHLRADLKDLRSKMTAALDQYEGKTMPDSVRADLDAWSDEMEALVPQYRAVKANEDRAAANRHEMEAIFRGEGGEPTSDGDLSRKSGARGFAQAFMSQGFHPKSNPTVTSSFEQAFDLKASVTTTGAATSTWAPRRVAGLQEMGRDEHYLWRYLPVQPVGDETAIEDFRQIGSRTITGDVERAVGATTEKATLDIEIDHIVTSLKQLAVVMDEVPNQVIRSIQGIEQLLSAEMRFAVETALDAHVVATINTANPPNASWSNDMLETIRKAQVQMRALGYDPDLIALHPSDSATIDLLQDNENRYYFDGPTRQVSHRLWGMEMIEGVAKSSGNAYLIDSSRIGLLYLGTLRLEADPFTGFKNNLTDFRFEGNALMHIRDVNAVCEVDLTA